MVVVDEGEGDVRAKFNFVALHLSIDQAPLVAWPLMVHSLVAWPLMVHSLVAWPLMVHSRAGECDAGAPLTLVLDHPRLRLCRSLRITTTPTTTTKFSHTG
jgi:hypothetical protein